MSQSAAPAATGSGEDNPYIRAFRRISEVRSSGIPLAEVPAPIRPRVRTPRQLRKLRRASHQPLSRSRKRVQDLNKGATVFLASANPTIGTLIEYVQEEHNLATRSDPREKTPNGVAMARVDLDAREAVRREYAGMLANGLYGKISCDKPDDTVRIMFENFSSLGLFATGPLRHKKIRQINKLAGEYSVDILAGCETRTDWRFVTDEESKFTNLFGNGNLTRGVCASNVNDGRVKRDQWGGTCITAVGRFSSSVKLTGIDITGLGRWSWLLVGGGGKTTRVVSIYQPCQPSKTSRGDTVWDQHRRYFEARGEVRNPRTMFLSDLISLLRRWKAAGDEILLLGDFNENVYTGNIAKALTGDELRMTEMCKQATGRPLPPTHNRGTKPIDAIYGTPGIECTAVALLPNRVGVGDHRAFMIDLTSVSVLGDVLPRVVPATGRLLNCASDRIKHNYIKVLNQLTNRHNIFKKLLIADQESDNLSPSQVQLRMNCIDAELEQFMKASERECHKYIQNDIEWSPYAGVWLHRRWLLTRVRDFLLGKTRDPRNLFRDCKRRGVKDPRTITADELAAEFYVCKHNLSILAKNSPYLRRKFLKGLVNTAKAKGDLPRAGKITGILHKEASRKRWKRVNRSTGKARGGLTVAVKVPTADGGVAEYKTKEGVYGAVSEVISKRFRSALVAQCHRGKFFEDIGHLADGPAAQDILEGTYEYPQDLDPATRLLFEEASYTYASLSPSEIA